MKSPIYILHPGRTPLLVSLPHAGTGISASLFAAMQPRAREVEDTDWFLDRLTPSPQAWARAITPRTAAPWSI
jgi:N-formylglutamate deformylase